MSLNNVNIISVLLLGARVAAAAAAISLSYEHKAWLMLSWVSTVAGNLSLLGSAANLIVCEQARRAPHLTYNLSFWKHLKFGVPSTLIVTAIGLTLIHSSSSSSTYVPAKTLILCGQLLESGKSTQKSDSDPLNNLEGSILEEKFLLEVLKNFFFFSQNK